jgi:hypothetical protein
MRVYRYGLLTLLNEDAMKIVHGIIVLAAFALAVWIGLAGCRSSQALA